MIVCENPKHSLKLLNKQGIKKRLLSLHDYNEKAIINKIFKLEQYSKIVLISDSGSPLISDPGYKLVKFFIDNGHYVTTIPGSSSIISALQLSGLPMNNFAFYGFVPKQKSKKKQFFIKIQDVGLTSIIFVSALNLKNTVENIIEIFGEKNLAICKELTKLNEKVFRGTANKLLKLIQQKKITLKGEYTVIIEGKIKEGRKKISNDIKKQLNKLMKKYNLTEAVKIVHSLTSISKKEIYQVAIKLKND